MASPKSFPLVRGRTMRVTATDGCCQPAYSSPDGQVVTDGFVSVALTANITTPTEISIQNANGETCVRDQGCPEFNGYTAVLTFCNVTPCLFSIVTGQPVVLDATGNAIGFRMNSNISACVNGFALEVWMGVPGVACTGDAGAYGYMLLPCLQNGVVGDFTIENAAITFQVTGAITKSGNGWGLGPYNVLPGAGGAPTKLAHPLDPDDHLYVAFTTVAPPAPTDGCIAVPAAPVHSTGATQVSGGLGTWTPAGSTPPASVADLIAGIPNVVAATPTTAWTTGSYVQTNTIGTAGHAHWGGTGTGWVTGAAP